MSAASSPAVGSTPDLDDSTLQHIGGRAVHPAANLFPMLPEDELEALAADISDNGQLEPVVLLDGRILDGRNRAAACELVGIDPVTVDWDGQGQSPEAFIVSQNLRRRHLTASQRAAIAVALERWIAQSRRAATDSEITAPAFSHVDTAQPTPPPAERPVSASPFVVNELDLTSDARARNQAAKAMSVAPAYVGDAKNLAESDPALFNEVLTGKTTLPEAQRQQVRQATEDGTIDSLKMRPSARRVAEQQLVARGALTADRHLPPTPTRSAAPNRPAIKIARPKKFGKVSSSRVTVDLQVTFGNPKIAEEILATLNDDPRVLDISHEVRG